MTVQRLHRSVQDVVYFWPPRCLLRMPLAVSRAASADTGMCGVMPAPSQAGPVVMSEWTVGMLMKMSVSPTRKDLGGWEPPAVVSPTIIARPCFFMMYTNSSAAPTVAPLVRMTRLFLEPYLGPEDKGEDSFTLKHMSICIFMHLRSYVLNLRPLGHCGLHRFSSYTLMLLLKWITKTLWLDFFFSLPVRSVRVQSSVVVPDGLSYNLSNTICLSASKKYEQKPAMAVVGPPMLFLQIQSKTIIQKLDS